MSWAEIKKALNSDFDKPLNQKLQSRDIPLDIVMRIDGTDSSQSRYSYIVPFYTRKMLQGQLTLNAFSIQPPQGRKVVVKNLYVPIESVYNSSYGDYSILVRIRRGNEVYANVGLSSVSESKKFFGAVFVGNPNELMSNEPISGSNTTQIFSKYLYGEDNLGNAIAKKFELARYPSNSSGEEQTRTRIYKFNMGTSHIESVPNSMTIRTLFLNNVDSIISDKALNIELVYDSRYGWSAADYATVIGYIYFEYEIV